MTQACEDILSQNTSSCLCCFFSSSHNRHLCCFDIILQICQLKSLPSAPPIRPSPHPATHPHRPLCHLLSGLHPSKAKLSLLT